MSASVVESVREAQRTTVEVESVDYASELVDVRRLGDGQEYRIRLREFTPEDRQRLEPGVRVEHVWLCVTFADGHVLSGQTAMVLDGTPRRTWPVQGHSEQMPDGTWRRVPPCRVSDADARRAYEAYAAIHGRSQSFERLHERGGFGRGELDRLAPGWVPIEVTP